MTEKIDIKQLDMDNKGAEQLLREIYKDYSGHHGHPDIMMTHFLSDVLDICDHLDMDIKELIKKAEKFRSDI